MSGTTAGGGPAGADTIAKALAQGGPAQSVVGAFEAGPPPVDFSLPRGGGGGGFMEPIPGPVPPPTYTPRTPPPVRQPYPGLYPVFTPTTAGGGRVRVF